MTLDEAHALANPPPPPKPPPDFSALHLWTAAILLALACYSPAAALALAALCFLWRVTLAAIFRRRD